MRKLAFVLGGLVVLVVVAFIALRTPDSDAAAMREKYGGPDPRFAETSDGLSVHYRDQGCADCPAIILVHGSNASLQTFEPVVEILKGRYRLISYDQPGHGLTGPHPRDDYSARGMFEALDAVVTESMVDRYWELMRYPGNRRAAGLRAIVDREPQYGQRLTEISVPTLVLWGAQDGVTLPHNAKTFDEMIPNSRSLIFEGVGHLPMEEAPERTALAIDAFLSEGAL